MPGTKILNVQKTDSFDEVFEAFSSADANEVIFIFPKGSLIAKEPAYFEAIKQEAERKGAAVNIMTSDPLVAHLASQNGFGLLQSPAPKQRRATVVSAPPAQPELQPEPEPEPTPVAQEAIAHVESTLIAELAAARRKKVIASADVATVTPPGKRIRDIVSHGNDQSIDVDEQPETNVDLPISRTSFIPPKPKSAISASEADIERLWEQEEKEHGSDDRLPSQRGDRRFSKKLIFIPAGIAVVVLGAVLYTTVGSATIVLTPHTEPLDLKFKVTASSTVQERDDQLKKIPGQQFSVQKEVSGTYQLTVTKEVAQKAGGTITIKNTSAMPQRLVATTRFEAKDGKIFRIPETLTVPANGTITSTVYADRPGSEYNIGPSEFTVPGLKETPRYREITASSTAAMTGGFIGNAKVVTEQDFVKAKEELSAKAKGEAGQALKEQAGELKILENTTIKAGEPVVNAKVGEAAEQLEMKVTASADTVAFREADIRALIQNYLAAQGDFELVEKDLALTYTNPKIDATAKTLTFDLQATGKAATKVDTTKIRGDMKNKNREQLTEYFKNSKEVEHATITFLPFWALWVRTVPADDQKIDITVEL